MAFAPILVAVIIGVTAGMLRGGRLGSLVRTRIRHPELLVVAIGCSVVADVTDRGPTGLIALVGLLSGFGFVAANIHLTGMAVIGVGIMANLVPVAANGAMPVRPEALVEAEMVTADELDRVSLTGARELADDQTILEFLGDTLPVRWTGQVVSIGDLIMLVGLADLVANLMLQRRHRRLPPSTLLSLAAWGWSEPPPAGLAPDAVDLASPDPEPRAVSRPPDPVRPPGREPEPTPALPAPSPGPLERQPALSSTSASPAQD